MWVFNLIAFLLIRKIVLSNKEKPKADRFNIRFYQTFRKYKPPEYLKPLYKTQREGAVPYLFHEGSITLSPKLKKATTEKENYISLSQMKNCNPRCKNSE